MTQIYEINASVCRSQTCQNCKGVSEMSEGWETLTQAHVVLLGQRSGATGKFLVCLWASLLRLGVRSALGFGNVDDSFCTIVAMCLRASCSPSQSFYFCWKMLIFGVLLWFQPLIFPLPLHFDLKNSAGGLCALSLQASSGKEDGWALGHLPLIQPHQRFFLPLWVVQSPHRMG